MSRRRSFRKRDERRSRRRFIRFEEPHMSKTEDSKRRRKTEKRSKKNRWY
jgi:hypothetical protein